MNKNIMQIEDCCGCFACGAVCPSACIEKKQTEKGFFVPHVNERECINCGKCIKVCPMLTDTRKSPKKIFAARHNDADVVKNSTSGGTFTCISSYIIGMGGVACGAVFNGDFDVIHICSDSISDRDRMRGSKYVKSDTSSIYNDVKANLLIGKTVLFSGTPCQVEAVKQFCNIEKLPTNNLYTVDIVCHGTPSPIMFRKHLEALQKKYGKITKYKFRDKNVGWRGQNVSIEFEGGKVLNEKAAKVFSRLYFNSYITMPSCHSCKYSSIKRVGDITLGDFWGVEKFKPELSDNKGVSLVMVNTPKGEIIMENIAGELSLWEANENLCMQPNLKAPTGPNKNKDKFYKIYTKYGFKWAIIATNIWGFTNKIKAKLSLIIKKI
ncbi:MAG: Coenzyme F420 hydrogenase/dehydrogenase, beta subunit C-terminal domain [Clostridia bacterium]|nr:Coenzyme F420 hydrogenase/dehydrogenase, beta subunit C-terminal domain [Clostridia bacterium]